MKKFRVYVDNDLVADNATGWSTPGGNLLVLDFDDGSVRGFSGFVDFRIEVVANG